jgi:YlmC/YmxH family sporulation protein
MGGGGEMPHCTTVSLRKKEIINLCDGSRLGFATEFEFDPKCATLTSLMVSRGGCGFLGLGKPEYLFIPWCKIECIGEDTILVRLTQSDISCCTCPSKKGRHRHF